MIHFGKFLLLNNFQVNSFENTREDDFKGLKGPIMDKRRNREEINSIYILDQTFRGLNFRHQ